MFSSVVKLEGILVGGKRRSAECLTSGIDLAPQEPLRTKSPDLVGSSLGWHTLRPARCLEPATSP